MSTTARKARKRAGTKFERTPKVGTPIQERTTEHYDRYWLQWHPRQKRQQYGVSRRLQKKYTQQAELLAK